MESRRWIIRKIGVYFRKRGTCKIARERGECGESEVLTETA